MKKNNRKLKIVDCLVVISVLLLQVANFCARVTYLSPFLNIIRFLSILVALFCFIINISKRSFSAKKMLVIFVLTAIAFISWGFTNDYLLLYVVFFSILFLDEPIEKIVHIDLISKIIVLLFVIVNYYLGFTNQQSFFRDRIERKTMGFTHPNTLGFVLVSIISDMMLYYGYGNHKKKASIMILAILSIIVTLIIDARSASIILILLVVNYLVLGRKETKSKRKREEKRKKWIAVLPIVFVLLSVFSTMLFKAGNSTALKINELLSDRLSYQASYEKEYDINLFGQSINFENAPLDNGYYRIIYNYGIVGALMILGLLSFGLKEAECKKSKNLRNIIIIFLIYAFSEWYPLRLSTSPYGFISIGKISTNKKEEGQK